MLTSHQACDPDASAVRVRLVRVNFPAGRAHLWKPVFPKDRCPGIRQAPAWSTRPIAQSGLVVEALATSPDRGFSLLSAIWLAVIARFSGEPEFVLRISSDGLERQYPAATDATHEWLLDADLGTDPSLGVLVTGIGQLLSERLRPESSSTIENLPPERQPATDGRNGSTTRARVGLRMTGGAARVEPAANEPDCIDLEELRLEVHVDDDVTIQLRYRSDLFDALVMQSLTDSFVVALTSGCQDQTTPLSQLPLLDPKAREQVLSRGHAPARPYPREGTLYGLFAEQVAAHPLRPALRFRDGVVTYADLANRAAYLAARLAALGVGAGSLVAVCLDRSADTIVSLVAILQAGGAYLPIEPAWPLDRIREILADCEPTLVIGSEHDQPRIAEGIQWLSLDRIDSLQSLPAESWLPVLCPAAAQDLAYLSFTSGSSGRPKGVCVTQRNVIRLVRNANFLQWDVDDVSLHHSPLAFDASTLEIWGPLLNGGCVGIAPPGLLSLTSLGRWMRRYQATVVWLTSAVFHALVEDQVEQLQGLRVLMTGGDVVSLPHARTVLRQFPQLQFLNGYGPTENTTFTTTCCPVSCEELQDLPSLPIGRPISNTSVYVLDQLGSPVPLGAIGEIFAAGDGVARGYWKRPELTAERFLPDSFVGNSESRMYRTGDLGRWRSDGQIEFHGRRDRQVKLKGFRIELEEIEAVLAAHPAVRRSAVLVRAVAGGRKSLAAFAIVDRAEITSTELMDELRERLPGYMLPSTLVILDHFPCTPNGKLNETALMGFAADATVANSTISGQDTQQKSRP